jgi:hypothetical protein
MQLLTVAISSKNFWEATPHAAPNTNSLLSGLPSRPSYFSSSSFNPSPLPRFDIDNQQVAYSLCEGAFTAISCSSVSFYRALRLLLFFVCICRRLKQFIAFYYRKQQIALHMDTKFYHHYIDIS